MSNEEVEEVKNEEATEPVANEIVETTKEEQPTEEIKEATNTTPVEQIKEVVKPKATAKKLPGTVKVVELVECGACNKKMLPKSLRNTHPNYCKGQPTETLPVNRQKASYGTKVEQKLRKEIEEKMKKKYETRNEIINYSEPVEVKTKPKPSVPIMPSVPKQLTATELLQQSYNEMKRLRQQQKQEKINAFKVQKF